MSSQRPIRVLCVDDMPDVTACLQMLIASDPSMACVGCLASALDLPRQILACEPAPDVLILDATMPGTDTLETLRALAAECPNLRTIIFSGHDDPAFIDRVIDAGAWTCVSKSAPSTALLDAVRYVAQYTPSA